MVLDAISATTQCVPNLVVGSMVKASIPYRVLYSQPMFALGKWPSAQRSLLNTSLNGCHCVSQAVFQSDTVANSVDESESSREEELDEVKVQSPNISPRISGEVSRFPVQSI